MKSKRQRTCDWKDECEEAVEESALLCDTCIDYDPDIKTKLKSFGVRALLVTGVITGASYALCNAGCKPVAIPKCPPVKVIKMEKKDPRPTKEKEQNQMQNTLSKLNSLIMQTVVYVQAYKNNQMDSKLKAACNKAIDNLQNYLVKDILSQKYYCLKEDHENLVQKLQTFINEMRKKCNPDSKGNF
jgi:Pyruvate/2-oxoacid:ferredoxin oxidoreductase delta subunit